MGLSYYSGSIEGKAQRAKKSLPDGLIITPDIRDAERLQGFYSDWTRPAEEVARASLRWSLVGNAITVPVAEWLGLQLAQPRSYERDRDADLASDRSWPRAARFDGVRRIRVEIGALPVWRKILCRRDGRRRCYRARVSPPC
jgi:DNA (cytosine-5)-methyltransferase 1